MAGADPIASVACLAVTIPANSICTLKSLSYVYGVKSTTPKLSPTEDQYDWRMLFNTYNDARTTDVRLQVVNGPSTNLISRLRGDLYDRSVTESEMATSMAWGSTPTGIAPGVTLPLNKAEINFTGISDIVTGDFAQTVYIKMTAESMQKKTTWMVWANTTSDPSGGDISLNFDAELNPAPTALAAKVVADVRPREVVQPVPACGLEIIDGKMAVCWPASFGTNYVVQIIGSFSQTTQLGFRWEDLAVAPALSAAHAKYCVDIPTNSPTAFFRLRSR
jgi:hypothetical protein